MEERMVTSISINKKDWNIFKSKCAMKNIKINEALLVLISIDICDQILNDYVEKKTKIYKTFGGTK